MKDDCIDESSAECRRCRPVTVQIRQGCEVKRVTVFPHSPNYTLQIRMRRR